MGAVDEQGGAVKRFQHTSLADRSFMKTLERFGPKRAADADSVVRIVPDMLSETAAGGNVDQMHALADTEDRTSGMAVTVKGG